MVLEPARPTSAEFAEKVEKVTLDHQKKRTGEVLEFGKKWRYLDLEQKKRIDDLEYVKAKVETILDLRKKGVPDELINSLL
ncbi:unnamed protein product [Phytophthora lilii]|uniref:Unnamed protein product n=1 Tax=Phytophthora lilii TaxID=2077276 RepID=A0A9W6XC33_9STRA|nr:unnamed protein product [Phytophthora lilii]